ncbi:hypothetical protein [Pseudomonas sp. Q1-7]|uniref:hypothetical protein n=1 Tax=Pseudomonas sp. Q1-7 TaxID=3020843 RepID=UPI0023016AE8|nr:hypothetical protein [Pseudomonas sp. Q1-7]
MVLKRGRYYLGRVVKINLTQDALMDALVQAPTITIGKFDWTITDVVDSREGDLKYIFGKLSKFAKDGHVTVIDEENRSQVDADAPNLLVASSPFVYLPEFSGMAFLHVWDGIQEDVFPRRIQKIVEAAYDGLLVSCEVEPVADYRAFTSRLKRLSKFIEFSATVYPPNPLFGRLWAELNNYIGERNASEVSIKEQTSKPNGLKSKIIELMDKIILDRGYQPEAVPGIADAAILMAADGYGKGKVIGVEDGEEVVIKTSDTQKSFLFSKDPLPAEFAEKARVYLGRVSIERDMGHR